MRAIRIHEHGAETVLHIDEIPEPHIAADEVLIKVKTAALNHLDLWVRDGIPGVSLPLIMGSDAAGTVEQIGQLAQRDFAFQTGDKVITVPIRTCGHCEFCVRGEENLCRQFHIPGESVQGVQAEFIAVPAKYIVPKPANFNWEEAAALPLAAMTAYHMLVRKANLRYNDWILIYGASSGVGSAAIQMAKAIGAKIITTVGSAEKARLAESLGAHYVLNYTEGNIGKKVRRITGGRGVDVVFEHTGMKTWNDSLRALRTGGKLVTCGATTGPIVKIDIRALFIRHQQLIGSTMGTQRDMLDVLQMADRGQLKPLVSKIFSFEQIKEAHRFLAEGRQFGKVVIRF